MRHAWLLIALAGCVSDLSVGMSTGLISEPDAEVSELDAGRVRDATVPPLDGLVVYIADGSSPIYDAGPDGEQDAGPSWKVCLAGDCTYSFVGIDKCMNGRPPVCARPYPTEACEFTCDDF